jgi:hypothetical protein
MRGKTLLTLIIAMFLAATTATAQEAAPEVSESEATAEAAQQEASPDASPAAAADGGRFRFGINGTLGLESVSAGGASASGLMYGVDVRLGWQFSHMLAIYAQPHLSFGSISEDGGAGSVSGFTGTFVFSVLGELTFLDRFFAGAGLGYGIFNNPSGFAIDLKAGGYPLVGRDENGIRRTGLMLGLDFRTVFLDGATGLLIMGCVGYESF